MALVLDGNGTMTVGNGSIVGLNAGGLPDASITQADLATNVAGNGPAFSAYTTTSVSATNNVTVKMPFNAEQYDTNSNYDATTNYRFTPTVAGYYQINASIYFGGAGTGSNAWAQCIIRQNATPAQYYGSQIFQNSSSLFNVTANPLIYCNGTTDYIECYFYQTNNASSTITINTVGSATNMYSYFQGYLVRSA